MKEGFYYLKKRTGNEKGVVVYGYNCDDANGVFGYGFNTYDGGGFIPHDELTDDTMVIPVTIKIGR